MDLQIASPLFHRNMYGIDYRIAHMCKDIDKYVRKIEYGSGDIVITIEPMIVPFEILQFGFWPERISTISLGECVIVCKRINYEKYVKGDFEERKKLMLGNVFRSIRSIKGKCNIDYDRFEKDILDMFNYKKEDIKPYMKSEKIKIVNESEKYLTKVYMISPIYYSDINEVGNEAEEVAEKISKYVVDKSYGEDINRIFVFPMAAPDEIYEKNLFFENLQYEKRGKYAIIEKRIDYEKYLNASSEDKKKYLVANLLAGIKELPEIATLNKRVELDYERFEKDVLMCLDYSKEDIENFM